MGGETAFLGGKGGWAATFGGGTGGGVARGDNGGPVFDACGECVRGLTGTFGGPFSPFGVGRTGGSLPALLLFGTGGGGAVLRGDVAGPVSDTCVECVRGLVAGLGTGGGGALRGLGLRLKRK